LILAALYRTYGTTIRLSLYLAVALGLTLIVLWLARETVGEASDGSLLVSDPAH
jgi:hypothetical protein